MRRFWAAVLGVTTAVIMVASAEVAVRFAHPLPPEPGLDEFITKSRRFLEPCDRTAHVARPMITVVGESSGMFLSQALQELAARSGALFGVRNCAMGASSFEQLTRRLPDALQDDPDALVVVFGHNYAFRYPSTRWEFFLLELRRRSHLARALAPALNDVNGLPGPRPPVDALKAFLHEAADAARARGVQLVVNTVTPNLLLPPAAQGPAANSCGDRSWKRGSCGRAVG